MVHATFTVKINKKYLEKVAYKTFKFIHFLTISFKYILKPPWRNYGPRNTSLSEQDRAGMLTQPEVDLNEKMNSGILLARKKKL